MVWGEDWSVGSREDEVRGGPASRTPGVLPGALIQQIMAAGIARGAGWLAVNYLTVITPVMN